MKKPISFSEFKKRLLKDPEIKRYYDDSEAEYQLMVLIIEKRIAKGLTQSDLAKKIGTKQSAIARLESGNYNPSFAFLNKVAIALDTKLKVTFHAWH